MSFEKGTVVELRAKVVTVRLREAIRMVETKLTRFPWGREKDGAHRGGLAVWGP